MKNEKIELYFLVKSKVKLSKGSVLPSDKKRWILND